MFLVVRGGGSARKADLAAISDDCLENVGKPRRLTALWASTACYRDSFTFYLLHIADIELNKSLLVSYVGCLRFESLNKIQFSSMSATLRSHAQRPY
jgi:hypothetical protein